MNRKNLLYLNLSVDEKDVSLGFAKTWTNQFSENFENVDIITLKKPAENTEYQNVKIYGISDDNKSTKFNKYIQIKNIIKKLTAETDYDLCFSHMSPLLLVLTKIYSKNKNTPRVLWYTHPKPKELSKRLILRLSLIFSNKVVTASKSSFPYKSKKVNIIGHAIDYELFESKRNNFLNKDFIILSRISQSKNIELALDSFLNSKFKNNLITVVGDSVTTQDKEYKKFLENRYKNNDNVIVTPSGLQYQIIEYGEKGKNPTENDKVKVHYIGTFIDDTKFDSSYERGEPATFPVNGVIPGWVEALQLMKPGAKYKLFIPSNLAYGERGAGGSIGPNATLIFEVELISVGG